MADDYLVRCEMRSICITCDSPFGKIDISDRVCCKHDKRSGRYKISWRPEITEDEDRVEGETFNKAFLKYVSIRIRDSAAIKQ